MKSKTILAGIMMVNLFSAHNIYAVPTAQVNLSPKSESKTQGELHLVLKGEDVLLKGKITGLTPNSVHGFHVHENGDCSSKDGKSAGGHFNPNKKNHGGPEMNEHHAGDLGNIRANDKGEAIIDKKYSFISLKEGDKESILNKAVIIHSGRDDLKSRPSGDAGKRIACGVIKSRS